MGAKHKLKGVLRELYARTLFHTGLHAVLNALMPRRLTILAGHCVKPSSGPWPAGEHLPADMSISERKLEHLLRWFGRRYELVSIRDGVERLSSKDKRSLLALSMDDGYRDNARVLGPLLKRVGANATIFLETRPLDSRKVNWSHKYFWILARHGHEEFVASFGKHSGANTVFHALNQIVAEGRGNELYHLKRILKYECDPIERDRVIDLVFRDFGGDETALCEQLYMSWDEARELARAGVELGGHTVSHHILSKLDAAAQEREIEDGVASMRRELGGEFPTFAYPWGRRWDFDERTKTAVKKSGFKWAVTMHSGINRPDTERSELRRLAIDDSAQLHLLATEACGGFELLRKVGLDLNAQ